MVLKAPASTQTNGDPTVIQRRSRRRSNDGNKAATEEGEAEPAGTKITCKKAKGKKRKGGSG